VARGLFEPCALPTCVCEPVGVRGDGLLHRTYMSGGYGSQLVDDERLVVKHTLVV
jgi:hypothetical protein